MSAQTQQKTHPNSIARLVLFVILFLVGYWVVRVVKNPEDECSTSSEKGFLLCTSANIQVPRDVVYYAPNAAYKKQPRLGRKLLPLEAKGHPNPVDLAAATSPSLNLKAPIPTAPFSSDPLMSHELVIRKHKNKAAELTPSYDLLIRDAGQPL